MLSKSATALSDLGVLGVGATTLTSLLFLLNVPRIDHWELYNLQCFSDAMIKLTHGSWTWRVLQVSADLWLTLALRKFLMGKTEKNARSELMSFFARLTSKSTSQSWKWSFFGKMQGCYGGMRLVNVEKVM